jgi:hypothetical protein
MKKYRIVKTQTEHSFYDVPGTDEQDAWDRYQSNPEDYWVGAAYNDDIKEEISDNGVAEEE